MSATESYADALRDAAANRVPIPPLTDSDATLTTADAYRIQRINIDRAVDDGARIVGHKVGLTSKAMQDMLGVNEPDFGVLLDDMVLNSGATIPWGRLIQPRVEAEIAFRLAADLAGPGISTGDVLEATAGVCPSLEIIDSRISDWKIALVDTVADNGSSAIAVIGEVVPLGDLDLRAVGCYVELNGELAEHGAGAAVLGHPAACVAWLANTLGALGDTLRAGQLVLPGALHRAVAVASGDVVSATFGGVGSVSVRFGG